MTVLSAGLSGLDSFLQLIGVLLIFVFVLALTYFTTRWIANYQKGQNHNKNLRIVETIRVTNNKYIQIVEAGKEYLVIAVGKDEIHLLTKLSEEQLKVPSERDAASGEKNVSENFQDVFEKLRGHLPKNRQKDE